MRNERAILAPLLAILGAILVNDLGVAAVSDQRFECANADGSTVAVTVANVLPRSAGRYANSLTMMVSLFDPEIARALHLPSSHVSFPNLLGGCLRDAPYCDAQMPLAPKVDVSVQEDARNAPPIQVVIAVPDSDQTDYISKNYACSADRIVAAGDHSPQRAREDLVIQGARDDAAVPGGLLLTTEVGESFAATCQPSPPSLCSDGRCYYWVLKIASTRLPEIQFVRESWHFPQGQASTICQSTLASFRQATASLPISVVADFPTHQIEAIRN